MSLSLLISSWTSFRTPRVDHTALPAPSVHHDCMQLICVSQACYLQQVVNISNFAFPGLHAHPLAATGQICWRLHHRV